MSQETRSAPSRVTRRLILLQGVWTGMVVAGGILLLLAGPASAFAAAGAAVTLGSALILVLQSIDIRVRWGRPVPRMRPGQQVVNRAVWRELGRWSPGRKVAFVCWGLIALGLLGVSTLLKVQGAMPEAQLVGGCGVTVVVGLYGTILGRACAGDPR